MMTVKAAPCSSEELAGDFEVCLVPPSLVVQEPGPEDRVYFQHQIVPSKIGERGVQDLLLNAEESFEEDRNVPFGLRTARTIIGRTIGVVQKSAGQRAPRAYTCVCDESAYSATFRRLAFTKDGRIYLQQIKERSSYLCGQQCCAYMKMDCDYCERATATLHSLHSAATNLRKPSTERLSVHPYKN